MPEELIAGHHVSWRRWERPGGRVALALHCSLAHAGAWRGVAEQLRGTTLVAMDLPGHGRAADWDGVHDFHDVATAMARGLIRRIAGGAPVDLVGHSFGATVCLRLALESPALVRRLVLIEPPLFAAARDTAEGTEACATHSEITRLIERDPAAGAAQFHRIWGAGERLAELPAHVQHYILARIHLVAVQSAALDLDQSMLLRAGGLEGISAPALLIEGADGAPIIDIIHGVLARRLPSAVRMIVPGARHMLPVTHPAITARAIDAHLARS